MDLSLYFKWFPLNRRLYRPSSMIVQVTGNQMYKTADIQLLIQGKFEWGFARRCRKSHPLWFHLHGFPALRHIRWWVYFIASWARDLEGREETKSDLWGQFSRWQDDTQMPSPTIVWTSSISSTSFLAPILSHHFPLWFSVFLTHVPKITWDGSG